MFKFEEYLNCFFGGFFPLSLILVYPFTFKTNLIRNRYSKLNEYERERLGSEEVYLCPICDENNIDYKNTSLLFY